MVAHVPVLGDAVPVQLPSELVRGIVEEVTTDDDIVVSLTIGPPFLNKLHGYKFGDRVKCRRSKDILAGYRWEVVRE